MRRSSVKVIALILNGLERFQRAQQDWTILAQDLTLSLASLSRLNPKTWEFDKLVQVRGSFWGELERRRNLSTYLHLGPDPTAPPLLDVGAPLSLRLSSLLEPFVSRDELQDLAADFKCAIGSLLLHVSLKYKVRPTGRDISTPFLKYQNSPKFYSAMRQWTVSKTRSSKDE